MKKRRTHLFVALTFCSALMCGCSSSPRRTDFSHELETGFRTKMDSICGVLQKTNRENIGIELLDPSKLVWSRNGLYAFVVYELNHPYKLLIHPFRPFIIEDKRLEFATVPRPFGDYPLVELARSLAGRASGAEDFALFENRPTSLGFFQYRRSYFGRTCELKTGERVVVATAVMPLWNGMEGSNLARVGPSILISAEMVDVLNSKADEVSTRKKLQDLSRLFAKEVAAGVAFSLGLPAERVTERLALRLLEDDHFRRYKDLAKFAQEEGCLFDSWIHVRRSRTYDGRNEPSGKESEKIDREPS